MDGMGELVMAKWNSENEAREEIKSLVAKYYEDFKKPEQERSLSQVIDCHMRPVYMTKKK